MVMTMYSLHDNCRTTDVKMVIMWTVPTAV